MSLKLLILSGFTVLSFFVEKGAITTDFLETSRLKLPHESLESTLIAGVILTIALFVLLRVFAFGNAHMKFDYQ